MHALPLTSHSWISCWKRTRTSQDKWLVLMNRANKGKCKAIVWLGNLSLRERTMSLSLLSLWSPEAPRVKFITRESIGWGDVEARGPSSHRSNLWEDVSVWGRGEEDVDVWGRSGRSVLQQTPQSTGTPAPPLWTLTPAYKIWLLCPHLASAGDWVKEL